MVKTKSLGYRAGMTLIYALLALIALFCVIPFIHVIAASLSTPEYLASAGFILWPVQFSLDTYQYIFSTSTVFHALGNTVFITVCGTIVNMVMTILMAYPLAHNYLPGKKVINFLVVFTMMFSGGMIPNYIIVRGLNLINSYWSVILPGAINAFNLIVLRNFFAQIPPSLEESARMDGCSEFRIFWNIYLPLILPAAITLGIMTFQSGWNSFMWPMIVLNSKDMMTIQVGLSTFQYQYNTMYGPLMAGTVIATIPTLLVFIFAQKYYIQGIAFSGGKE